MEKILFVSLACYFLIDFCITIYKRFKFKSTEAVCVKASDIWVHTEESSSYGKKGFFSYVFNNAEYRGQEKSYISSDKLKAGDRINIFVNSQNPQSFISEGAIKKSLLIDSVGIIIMIVAAIIS